MDDDQKPSPSRGTAGFQLPTPPVESPEQKAARIKREIEYREAMATMHEQSAARIASYRQKHLEEERRRQEKRYVTYTRVSTAKQGASGLGLEAQRDAIAQQIAKAGRHAVLVGEFTETESGRRTDRPQLTAAIELAQDTDSTLIIAKLDRLSRDVHFLTGLQKAGIKFIACDIPDATEFTINIFVSVAQHEREMISARTKAALAVKREKLAAEGKRLGNPNGISAIRRAAKGNADAVVEIKRVADEAAEKLRKRLAMMDPQSTMSARSLAKALNASRIKTPRGGRWAAQSVIRLRNRLTAMSAS